MNQHIHLIGIGGTGMGPLAKIFVEMGHTVSGSDLQLSDTTSYLTGLGAQVYCGHAAEHINGATKVVYSSAIPEHNVEILAARNRGIPVLHRSEVLAELLNTRRGIAVGGAHGKTTITSMLSLCLENAGLDPTVLIGAHFTPFGPGAKYGKGEFVVAEADESDGSFLRYQPEVTIVTSIEPDHLENYNGSFDALIAGYREFLTNCQEDGLRLIGVDDLVAAEMSKEFNCVTYGFSTKAMWRAEVDSLQECTAQFKVYNQQGYFGTFVLHVAGRHNIANALACIVVASYAGLTVEQIGEGLKQFTGAQRRFQIRGTVNDAIVVDDYAHHPTEIAAMINAAREGWKRRIIAVFQPHRYSRTQLLFQEFAQAFQEADIVVLTDIFSPPPEQPIEGISSERLAEKIASLGGPQEIVVVKNQDDVANYLRGFLGPEDLVLVMGAGPIWKVTQELL